MVSKQDARVRRIHACTCICEVTSSSHIHVHFGDAPESGISDLTSRASRPEYKRREL